MNIIKKFFLKRNKRKQYKKYINNHKKNILRAFFEMYTCSDLEWIMKDPDIYNKLWIRALEHDDSKFEKPEFEAYRRNFYPIDEEERNNSTKDFELAVKHHYQVNDHHWQNRINWKDEDFNINTELACLENIMDWLAVGMQFNNRPYQYYDAHKDTITLPKKQKEFIETCIYQGIDKKYIIKEKNNGL